MRPDASVLARMIQKFALWSSMLRYGWLHRRDFAQEHYRFFTQMKSHLNERIGPLEGLEVLEIGCGKSPWLSMLIASEGARVTAVDSEWVELGKSPVKYWRLMQRNGPERAARTLIWDFVFAPSYFRELSARACTTLTGRRLALRCCDAGALELPTNRFDLVVSHEVFEHLPNVPAALAEVGRVLKPSGLAYLYVHNFASLSGGHHIEWKYPDQQPSEIVPPWDHLRDRRYPLIPSWINGWREHQYRRAIDQTLELVDWIHGDQEGAALLTREISTELVDYDVDELLTKGFVMLAGQGRSR